VTPIRDPSAPRAGTAICSDLIASAGVRVTMDMLPSLRQRPGPGIGNSLPATFLRHADEQTVAALAAVLHAIQKSEMSVADFKDWGIVAAPCFLGRAALAIALQRLAAEGAWGISPHLIPHRSQHAVSGTISQVLKIVGPNFGAGGGPGSVGDALLAGAVLLEGNRLPGVWVVATDWEPEAIPDPNGCISPDAICHALALALVGARPGWPGIRLRVLPRTKGERAGSGAGQTLHKVSQLQDLLTTLAQEEPLPKMVVWPLDAGGWIELGKAALGSNGSPASKGQRSGGSAQFEIHQSGAGTESKR
jgi:hypothetical protein